MIEIYLHICYWHLHIFFKIAISLHLHREVKIIHSRRIISYIQNLRNYYWTLRFIKYFDYLSNPQQSLCSRAHHRWPTHAVDWPFYFYYNTRRVNQYIQVSAATGINYYGVDTLGEIAARASRKRRSARRTQGSRKRALSHVPNWCARLCVISQSPNEPLACDLNLKLPHN
jgi:hypothetical protein